MGAMCSNGNKVVQATTVSTKTKNLRIKTDFTQTGKRKEDDLKDKDGIDHFKYNGVERMHEKLWQAIENNDQAAADKFLDLNDVQEQNIYDPFGQSMLHRAAQLGYAEMLMMLIERTGAKPDLVNAQLSTPLHVACRNNKESVVKFLIGCGVDVNLQDEHGQTPLLICCIHGHKEILSLLVEASISGQLTEYIEINIANHQGLTPLNCASIKGDFDMVRTLVSRGGANVNQSSPKGCTPLMYAGRGGYSQVVEFLIDKKASALKQDNAGGTVLHHAIEKGHSHVLENMLSLGVDVYSAIEIADNAGRTPLFEAVENMQEDNEQSMQIIKILTGKKNENGFGANPNVVNYSGQTPLFSAARSGSLEAVQQLIEAGADPNLNNGEIVKPEDEQEDEEFESIEEKYFLEAFKNCMTPIHVASVLGFDEIAIYLAQNGADVNLQSKAKGYSALHLCVLSNKPEMIIELLLKTLADPMLEDCSGRALLDMVYQYIPSYVETFQQMLETLSVQRLKQQAQAQQSVVARHYVNADDERKINGAKTQEEIQQMYAKEMEMKEEESNGQAINLANIEESDLISEGVEMDPRVENVFGRKVALCLVSQNWQYKEQALKYVARTTEKFLTRSEVSAQTMAFTLTEMIDGSLAAVSLTCRDKVIKVFNISLQLFNMVIQSSRVERELIGIHRVLSILKSEQLIQKLLLQSEQSNTRVTNKIHEALLDLSFQAQLGEDHVSFAVFDLIKKHYLNNQNQKGLLAQLALLYKLINSFNVYAEQIEKENDSDEEKALTKDQILSVVLPAVQHTKDDIRGAAVKILIDVQKKTGSINLNDLESLPDKTRESVWEKIQETQLSLEQSPTKEKQKKVNVVNLEIDKPETQNPTNGKLTAQALDKYKQIISEKGSHKDWTQREIALTSMQECFSLNISNKLENEEDFLSLCLILLQTSLDENNIQIYLIAVEVVLLFILKVSTSEAVLDALPSIIQTIVLRTTDTNTRVRKRSVEVINQIWDVPLNKKSSLSASQMIANVLCDPALNEKAIIGRLGLFIKKALLIEQSQDISKKPLQLILGKDYEQLAQFSCQWCLHKNTKVRQCALKLAVEICRLNSIDPRGQPFKQRIINFILGLRSSIRDPLVKKINEVCLLATPNSIQYINETELELTLATKTRAASYDVRRSTKTNQIQPQSQGQTLPSIGASVLPSVVQETSGGGSRPTIVLPHSEPLSDTQKEQASVLIELFGSQLITCFYSQTWSSRFVAIQKVEEQLHNLDPNRRDAMSAEINRNNLPPEISFKTLLKFFEDGLKDPVLKNYISILELIQTSLPLYFRYLRHEQIKRELTPLIQIIVQKTSDLKQKIREASINLCLYLSHQSPIGPECMISIVLSELDSLSWEKQEVKKDVTNTFGNSNMIVSCLNLLAQFQLQTSLVTEESKYYAPYALNMNKALKHSNPQVRKEGENLFRTMYNTYQEKYIKEFKDQKPQLITKLLADAKAEFADKFAAKNTAAQVSAVIPKESQEAMIKEKAQLQMREDYLNQSSIQNLLKGHEDKLHQLKLPNPKKRLIAIVEIKKAVQQKLTQINQISARELVEPLSLLLRHLLRDENVDVYLESLNLLKFIVGNLAPHLSALDLHLMMGQFLTVIVSGYNSNMRARVSSDKVIVYFAKHTNIGSLVVAKEVLKNIERLNRSAFMKPIQVIPQDETQEEKKQILSRFYGILQMLMQQFSIVLCYQPEFYQKCLDLLSETMQKSVEEPVLKSTCTQLVTSLHQIDAKLLDQGVQLLDFTKKTHIKKIIIELENSSQKGLVSQNQNLVSGIGGTRAGSPDASFRDTQQSFTSLNSRTSAMSPGLNMNKRLSRDRNSEVRSSKDSVPYQAETPSYQRRMQLDSNSTEMSWLQRQNLDANKTSINLPSITKEDSGSNTARRRQFGQGFVGASSKAAGFNRNDFNMTGDYSNNQRKGLMTNDFQIGVSSGIGSNMLNTQKKPNEPEFKVPSMTSSQLNSISSAGIEQSDMNRPPLYVPTHRTLIKKQENYQPTIIQRMNSQNATQSSFGTNQMMGSTTSTILGGVSILPTPSYVKQNTTGQLPPAATFEIKKSH